MKKILYGICGIGNGHFFRQLPIIETLLKQNNQILFFAYGESLKLLNRFNLNPNVKIIEVAVPYFIGAKEGIDFKRSKDINQINKFNYNLNFEAFATAQEWLGKPDLVISDYEPVCAQYGYAYQSKVITIDQQSKFFTRNTIKNLNGFNCEDEIMRLNMFFPLAERLACSFFKVKEAHNVTIFPPIYREKIKELKRNIKQGHFIVYISAQPGFEQNIDDLMKIFEQRKETFHVFMKEPFVSTHNVISYTHGDCRFEDCLSFCEGVISTAGHNLLSECMYLNIPVYAMPLNLYEQQLNAYMIGKNNLGINFPVLTSAFLDEFIQNIPLYTKNIIESDVLFKESGENLIINKINEMLK